MKRIKDKFKKLGFTLMEVNLAIIIMATGVLAMVSLYPLGFRENQQSRDDVWTACEADRLFNQLHASLSERAIKWDDWVGKLKNIENSAGNWGVYCEENEGWIPKRKGTINGLAAGVLNQLSNIARDKPSELSIDTRRVYAIVVQPGTIKCNGKTIKDYSRIAISMRISRNASSLFSQPMYFTEIRFQGDQERQ